MNFPFPFVPISSTLARNANPKPSSIARSYNLQLKVLPRQKHALFAFTSRNGLESIEEAHVPIPREEHLKLLSCF